MTNKSLPDDCRIVGKCANCGGKRRRWATCYWQDTEVCFDCGLTTFHLTAPRPPVIASGKEGAA